MIRIIKIENIYVFPMFKNGKSSIDHYALENKSKWLINEQCKRAEFITVFLREPKQRFISGVHSFIEFEKRKNKNLDYDTMLYAIENYRVINEHFLPQYFWIKRLSKYFKGTLILKSVNDLMTLIPNRNKPAIPDITNEQKEKILKINFEDLKYDYALMTLMQEGQIQIKELIQKVENALS